MKNADKFIGWAFGVFSVYMVFDGFLTFLSTSGRVQGSEFGMLITLANQLGLVMMWLALFALRMLLRDIVKPQSMPMLAAEAVNLRDTSANDSRPNDTTFM